MGAYFQTTDKCQKYRFRHSVDLGENLIIPKSDDRISAVVQVSGAFRIVFY